ncbi:hypothetical protein D1007_06960 [Hordeum vulgare]|nr:hypothetical protein D1007_06960 [Hordeum vulgare]
MAVAGDTDSDGNRRVGGRFWVLADGTDEDNEEDVNPPLAVQLEVASPTPSNVICEAFQVGYSEEVVVGPVDAVIRQEDPTRFGLKEEDKVKVARYVVHRRTSATVTRPWRGSLPKSYDCMHYDLEVEVEEPLMEVNNTRNNDVDMMDGGDGSGNGGADRNLGEHGAKTNDMGLPSQSSKPADTQIHV